MKPEQVLDKIFFNLATDSDEDVRYYISDCIPPERLETYQKRKQEQDIEIAKELAIADKNDNSEDEELSALFTTLPPPPTLPAHLVTIPSLDQQIYHDDDKENKTIEEDSEEIYNSTESPMDIVDDYDDVEDMTLSIDQLDGTDIYEDANGDQVIPYIDNHHPIEQDKSIEDEVMTDMTNNHEEEDEEVITEKAQHVYLSKIPAHVVVNNNTSNNTITTTPENVTGDDNKKSSTIENN